MKYVNIAHVEHRVGALRVEQPLQPLMGRTSCGRRFMPVPYVTERDRRVHEPAHRRCDWCFA